MIFLENTHGIDKIHHVNLKHSKQLSSIGRYPRSHIGIIHTCPAITQINTNGSILEIANKAQAHKKQMKWQKGLCMQQPSQGAQQITP